MSYTVPVGKSSPFRIPKSLVIRGKPWKILYETDLRKSSDSFHKEALCHLGTRSPKCWGNAYPARQEIHLYSKHKSKKALASTFLHELLHACSSDKIDIHHEEKFVRDIEETLLEVLSQLKWRR